jgi:hypothetical protein
MTRREWADMVVGLIYVAAIVLAVVGYLGLFR